MCIKLKLLILFYCFALSTAFSQKRLLLEHTVLTYSNSDYNKCSLTVITGSFLNLKTLLLADMESFTAAMNENHYSLSTDRTGYLVNTVCRLQGEFMISKSTGQVTMIYSEETDISSLREEVKKLYPNANPHFVSGFEIYTTPVQENGALIKLQIYLQESQTGGGSITMKRF